MNFFPLTLQTSEAQILFGELVVVPTCLNNTVAAGVCIAGMDRLQLDDVLRGSLLFGHTPCVFITAL